MEMVEKKEDQIVALNKPNRNDILQFEKAISLQEGAIFGDSEAMPLKHTFAPGIYVREIFIPKGMTLTGKIHRHSHPNFLMKGEVIVVTEFGGKEHLKAPLSLISEAGTKRVVHAIEDTVWITIHATNETDLEKIEEYVIAPTYEDLLPENKKEITASEVEIKNCLVLALKKFDRDYSCLLTLEAKEYLLPFKKAIQTLKENNISIDGLFAIKIDDVWHVDTKNGTSLENIGSDIGQTVTLSDSDMVGAWVAVAIGGAAVAGGVTSYISGKQQANATQNASEIQLQMSREAIAAQEKYANKAFGIYQTQADKAAALLKPFADISLQSLDPNSAYSQQESAAYQRVLAANLSARGLTASGTEIAGLSDFALGRAGQRQNIAFGGLQGLAGTYQGVGQAGLGTYGNLGQNVGSTLFNTGSQQAGYSLAAGQAQAQGLVGIGNAFQTGLAGYGQYQQNQQQMNQNNTQFNSLLALLNKK